MGASIARAMRSFAHWVSGRPHRLILLTIVAAHILAAVAAALVVLDALRRGPVASATSALISMIGIVAFGLALGSPAGITLALIGPFLLGGVACGVLLAWSRSLSFAFQGTVLGIIGAAILVFGLVPQASQVGELLQSQTQAQVEAVLEAFGFSTDQLGLTDEIDPAEFVRLFLISLELSLLVGLMLGFWWYSLNEESVGFGTEFRKLKLGRFAGILLMLLLILGQLLEVTLIRYVAPLAVLGFLFQGLAVLHARCHSDRWPGAVLVVVYVALVSPLTFIALGSLSAVGLVDNFFELRARAEPEQ